MYNITILYSKLFKPHCVSACVNMCEGVYVIADVSSQGPQGQVKDSEFWYKSVPNVQYLSTKHTHKNM